MSRPAPERPGDALPTPDDFAGWPPLGGLRSAIECGPVPMVLERLDSWAEAAVADLASDRQHAEERLEVRLEFTRADRGAWLELRPGDGARTAVWDERGGLVFATHHAALLMDSEASRGIVVLTRQDEAETARSVQNVLRVACAWRLVLAGRGLLLHAAAVEAGDDRPGGRPCVLFLGESGAGKSTAASLSAPRAVLADDACLTDGGSVRPRQLFADPGLSGRRARSAAARSSKVAAIFRLKQGASHRIEPLRPPARVAALVAHAPFLLESMRPAALAIAERIAREVPVAELRFAKDPGFWTEIDNFLADAPRRTDTT